MKFPSEGKEESFVRTKETVHEQILISFDGNKSVVERLLGNRDKMFNVVGCNSLLKR